MDSNGRPGFGELVSAMFRAPLERRYLKMEAARHDALQFKVANATMQEVARLVEPDTDGFVAIGDGGNRVLDEADQDDLRTQARKAFHRSTTLRGYIMNLKRFVMGEGPTFDVPIEDEKLKDRILAWWRDYAEINDWDALEDEIPVRTWRDGEVFIRDFVHDTDGPLDLELSIETKRALDLARVSIDDSSLSLDLPHGMVTTRLIPPEQIADPSGNVSHGIITSAKDVQAVIAYMWTVDNKLQEVILAPEIQHIKINVDSDVKRGRSMLEPLLKRDSQHEDWLSYRLALNLVRTAFVLHKKVTGTPAQVSAIRDTQVKQRDTTSNDRKVRMVKPGTTIVTGPGVELEFKNPQIHAQDAKDDGRALLLTIAAATGLPEYMITGDSSNSNFASTMVSESPAIREFEHWQDFFRPQYERRFRRVMLAAAEHDAIEGLTTDFAKEMPISVEFPTMVARAELDHAKANDLRQSAGILSKEGRAKDEGIVWEVEKARLERERQEAVEFTPPAA